MVATMNDLRQRPDVPDQHAGRTGRGRPRCRPSLQEPAARTKNGTPAAGRIQPGDIFWARIVSGIPPLYRNPRQRSPAPSRSRWETTTPSGGRTWENKSRRPSVHHPGVCSVGPPPLLPPCRGQQRSIHRNSSMSVAPSGTEGMRRSWARQGRRDLIAISNVAGGGGST